MKSFTSLGYAISLLVVMILFYTPVENLLKRTAKEATNIKLGNAEITLSLPVVAVHYVKNELIEKAVNSEKNDEG